MLVHHARAFVNDDYPELVDLGPAAVAELRRQGQDHLAELSEPDLGVALLNLGRFAEHDVHMSALADRYRVEGPPTLLNLTGRSCCSATQPRRRAASTMRSGGSTR